ncbi:thioesterase [Nocardiopsis ansamitocini]|uniref:Thioesterase n=2 Tax=Nocardiopsis ansamitocini TaxID=1670832 RepID=A0A9W6UKX3_9ACTN|nr:thioesterase [Nocardiopsis ansamitocini]
MRPKSVRSTRWLLSQPSEWVAARLFCLPYSGCGASMYRHWPRFIGEDDEVELCAVQLPGRENRLREPNFSSFDALAEEMVDALTPYLDRPFGFFGHCSSALLAYEAVLRTARNGASTPARLFVSSQVAPHDGPYGRFLSMAPHELAEEVRGLLTRLGGEPRADMVSLTLDVLLSDIEVHRAYRVERPARVACPITSIGWDQDVEVPHQLMGGWSETGKTTFRLLGGNHHSFIDAPPELIALFADGLSPARTEERA